MDLNRLLKICRERIRNNEKTFIVTLNSLMALDYFFNKEFRKAVDRADLVIADGIGIIKASHFFGRGIKNHIPGIDFMHKLLGLAYENKLSVFLLGGTWDVVNKAYENMRKWFNHARFLGKYTGYFEPSEEEKIIRGINKVSPDILFVAMGSPRQELWIGRNREKLDCRVMIGVGGSFNVIAGKVKRAPDKWRKKGLEWLYRSLTSPKKFMNIFRVIFFLVFMVYFRIFLLNRKK